MTRNHIAFNDRWLIVAKPHRIDAYALQGQLYDRHYTLKAPFSLLPWRRALFGSIGLHQDTVWTFVGKRGSQSTLIRRYHLDDYGFVMGGSFSADEDWATVGLFFYAIGPHQVLIEEDHMRRWAVMRERIYHQDIVVMGLPHLSSYVMVNRDGVPYPIMYQRTRLLILDQNLNVFYRFDFNKPIRDATVDRWQHTCYCLMSDTLLVIHLNTGRVLQEIPLGINDFRVVWGQDGIIGVYAPERQYVEIFSQNGLKLDVLPGTLLVSDRGVAVSQPHNKEVILLYASSGVKSSSSRNGDKSYRCV